MNLLLSFPGGLEWLIVLAPVIIIASIAIIVLNRTKKLKKQNEMLTKEKKEIEDNLII